MNTDRDLLFGLLALQNDFIDRQQLVAAFAGCIADPKQSLAELLVEQKVIDEDARALLNQLVERNLKVRGDASRCLATLDLDDGLRSELSMLANTHLLDSISAIGSGVSRGSGAAINRDGQTQQTRDSGERFAILRLLDRGGLGVVNVAKDCDLNREVALKEIRADRADDARLREKFLIEAEVTGGLEHPGIVPVYALGKRPDGRLYYAMRLIRGENLRVYIRKFHEGLATNRYSYDGQQLRKLLRRFLDVCEAISYAHGRGVLHRDLKPSNIMLGSYGETLVVDWGLAKATGQSADQLSSEDAQEQSIVAPIEQPIQLSGSAAGSEQTREGAIIGTPAYAPPEQLMGQANAIGPPADIYGLGGILYEILTGKPPASGGDIRTIIDLVTSGNIPRVRTHAPQCPKALEAICHIALATKPADRFSTASALAAEIERWLDDAPVRSYRESWFTSLRRWSRKHPTLVSVSLVTTATVLIGLSILASITRRNNTRLAKLNQQLDKSNEELDASNLQLQATNVELTNAKQVAEAQSELALSTLTAVVEDLQAGLRGLPGGAAVRQRLLNTAFAKLERVAADVIGQERIDRSAMLTLREMGDTIAQFGEQITNKPSVQEQAPSQRALELLTRALEIAEALYATNENDRTATLDLAYVLDRLGSVTERMGDAKRAQELFARSKALHGQLLDQDSTNNLRKRDYSWACMQLARMESKLGNSQEARRLFGEALSIRRQRLADNPDDLEAARDVSTVTEKYALLLSALGENKESLALWEESLMIRERNLQRAPGNVIYLRDLLVANGGLADHLEDSGQVTLSLPYGERSVEIAVQIFELQPDDFRAMLDLAAAYDRAGNGQIVQGDSQKALEYFEKGMEVRRLATTKDPVNPTYLRELSISLDRVGKLLRGMGRLDDALALFEESLGTAIKLADQDPVNTMKQRDLSISYNKVGDIYNRQREYAKALPLFEKSLSVASALSMADPENDQKISDLLVVYSKLASAYSGLGDYAQAFDYLHKGLAAEQQRAAKQPQNLRLKANLALWYEMIGDVEIQKSDVEASLVSMKKSLDLRRELADSDRKNKNWQTDLVYAETNYARSLMTTMRWEEATDALNRSIAVSLTLINDDPDDLELQATAAQNYRFLNYVYGETGNDEQVIIVDREALKHLRSMTSKTIQNPRWNEQRCDSQLSMIGNLIEQQDFTQAMEEIDDLKQFVDLIEDRHSELWISEIRADIDRKIDACKSVVESGK